MLVKLLLNREFVYRMQIRVNMVQKDFYLSELSVYLKVDGIKLGISSWSILRWLPNILLREINWFSVFKFAPYAKQLKKQITMRLESDVIDYFKNMAKGVGIPYQSLINLYLRDCVASNRELKMQWQ